MFFDYFLRDSWVFLYRFSIHLIKLAEKQILAIEEMAEIVSLLKTFKEVKIGEKLGFFQSLTAGYTKLTWEMIIKSSENEKISNELIKEILTKYLRI